MTYNSLNELESLMKRLNLKVKAIKDLRHDMNEVQLEKFIEAVEKALTIRMLGFNNGEGNNKR